MKLDNSDMSLRRHVDILTTFPTALTLQMSKESFFDRVFSHTSEETFEETFAMVTQLEMSLGFLHNVLVTFHCPC